MCVSYLPDSNGMFQSGWCQSQLSSLWRKYVLLGWWTDLHHYSPGSLSCHIASTLMTQDPSPYRHMRKSNHHPAVFAAANDESIGGSSVGKCTSFSFRMLHWRGVTDAGLAGGSFCLISWAAASSRPVFRLEITTLQPEGKMGGRGYNDRLQANHSKHICQLIRQMYCQMISTNVSIIIVVIIQRFSYYNSAMIQVQMRRRALCANYVTI